MNALLAATVLFVGGHFLLSSQALRRALVARLGINNFRLLYSAVVALALVWMLVAYREAPLLPLWQTPRGLAWVPLLVMPFAFILAIAGLTTRSPTLVGGETLLESAAASENFGHGILSITRHPFLWGAALWAASHLLVNGTAADVILMGGILVLSLGGMRHIDQKRASEAGAGWGPVAMTTSLVPFAAILRGQRQLDWRGIGWWRPLAGIALYLFVLKIHAGLFGASPLPF
ncbi:MAG: NnrU family protein [Kiloniellales bacterium]